MEKNVEFRSVESGTIGTVDDYFKWFIYREGQQNFEVFQREDRNFMFKTSFNTDEGARNWILVEENCIRNEYGHKFYPTGDYSKVSSFEDYCTFDRDCKFGRNCNFGKYSAFGQNCEFESGCMFGSYTSFGRFCRFGKDCLFKQCCNFSGACQFGARCCFGGDCKLGSDCKFGESCSHEGLTNSTYFACDRIGSEKRKTYFFKSDEGFNVRAGCFFGTLEDFVKRVQNEHGGTKYEKEYLAAVELAMLVLEKED